jgi:hypothetical protein
MLNDSNGEDPLATANKRQSYETRSIYDIRIVQIPALFLVVKKQSKLISFTHLYIPVYSRLEGKSSMKKSP